MIIFISIATLVSTFLGGMFALRFKDKLHLNFNKVAKLTMEFTLSNDVKLIDAQKDTSELEKYNQVNECIDWYDIVMKKLRD